MSYYKKYQSIKDTGVFPVTVYTRWMDRKIKYHKGKYGFCQMWVEAYDTAGVPSAESLLKQNPPTSLRHIRVAQMRYEPSTRPTQYQVAQMKGFELKMKIQREQEQQ